MATLVGCWELNSLVEGLIPSIGNFFRSFKNVFHLLQLLWRSARPHFTLIVCPPCLVLSLQLTSVFWFLTVLSSIIAY